MSTQYKYHAQIQGRNATVWWKTALEAVIWKFFYNLWHNIIKDGKCITNIHKVNYVYIANLSARQEPQRYNRKQENRNKPRNNNRQVRNP